MIIDEPGLYRTQNGMIVIITIATGSARKLCYGEFVIPLYNKSELHAWDSTGLSWDFTWANIVSKAYLTDFEKELWGIQ